MTFEARHKSHDSTISRVSTVFESMGYTVDGFGVETNNLDAETSAELQADIYRRDPVARIVRFAPDKIVVHPDQCYFLELKTSDDDYTNHSYELDSFETIKRYSEVDCPVLVVFNNSRVCFASDITFHSIIVPKSRWPKEYADTIAERYSDTNVVYKPVSAGSRTPFGLIDKDANYLQQLTRFLWCLTRAGHPSHRTDELKRLLDGGINEE